MNLSDVNIQVIEKNKWGFKYDPTEYDYDTQTIRLREDYFRRMRKSQPLTHHWFVHEFAHHFILKHFGPDYIIKNSGSYPDNKIERFAFAYQFYYLMETGSCQTFENLYAIDEYIRRKLFYRKTLEHYWANANFIISEVKNEITKLNILS